jgi:PilZ domain
MAYYCQTERRSQRAPLEVCVRIQRRGGSAVEGRCVDASEEGFGIFADLPLEVGEIVRLTIGRAISSPTFIARVVWRQQSRVGLYCITSAD